MSSAALTETGRRDVLLVEDNEADTRLLMALFEKHGFDGHLHWVQDGEDALHFISKRGPYTGALTPDLVILDLNLPKVSGHDVLKFIREQPDLHALSVIVLTTSSLPNDMLYSYELKAKNFVTKPCDFSDFEELVKRILSIDLNLMSQREAVRKSGDAPIA